LAIRWKALREFAYAQPWQFWAFQIASYVRRGVTLNIVQSWKCNLSCDYCSWRIGTDGYPSDRRGGRKFTTKQWRWFVNEFPVKVRVIHVTGGEPTISDVTLDFIDWCLGRGFLVYVITNLTNDNLLRVRKSWRLRIEATCHAGCDEAKWLARLKRVGKKHRGIHVKELGGKRLPLPSDQKGWDTIPLLWSPKRDRFMVGPDGCMFLSAGERANYYAEHGSGACEQ